MSFLVYVAAGLGIASLSVAKEFHYGAAFGDPFKMSTACSDVNNIAPELLFNWGLDNHLDGTLNVCDNPDIHLLPYIWGRRSDDDLLAKVPDNEPPWAVILENEPNWWGPGHAGANMTAAAAAENYCPHTEVINEKWGGVVKLISPSPVNKYYPNCTNGRVGDCAWQSQLDWLDEYFARCGCYDDFWAINLHDYSCDVASSHTLVADLNAHYPGKNIFFGEVGCNGVPVETMAKYLTDFVAWAYTAPTVVGFVWAAINYVGNAGSELSLKGSLTPVGEAFKAVQRKYPPILAS